MSRLWIILIFLVGMAGLALFSGCDDRGTNLLSNSADRWGIDPAEQHVFVPELTLQLRNRLEQMQMAAYIPKVALPIGGTAPQPVPILILLAPEGGDQLHYFRAGLKTIAQEMIASGEIDPMVIYCVGNNPAFGGFFYANSAPAGDYDAIIGAELIDTLVGFRVDAIINQASKRGIGGVGQGAYGAFRAALKHPGKFSSISVADGPLDFDGAGNGGLVGLFSMSIAEQKAHHAANNPSVPFEFHQHFDSSTTMPLSRMLIGGALAFSPNDYIFEFTRDSAFIINEFLPPIVYFTITNWDKIAHQAFPGGGDSTTLISNVVVPGEWTRGLDFDFHMPFDSSGILYAPIWSMWMDNNLDALYADAGGNPLDSTRMWIATNPSAKWNYHEMTESWIQFLEDNGHTPEVYDYSTYAEDHVTGEEYLYDLLRKMLKFHSDNFRNN